MWLCRLARRRARPRPALACACCAGRWRGARGSDGVRDRGRRRTGSSAWPTPCSLRPLPPRAERIVTLWQTQAKKPGQLDEVAPPTSLTGAICGRRARGCGEPWSYDYGWRRAGCSSRSGERGLPSGARDDPQPPGLLRRNTRAGARTWRCSRGLGSGDSARTRRRRPQHTARRRALHGGGVLPADFELDCPDLGRAGL
jgi:hypothetical protein